MTDVNQLTVTMQVLGTSSTGTTITGTLEETDDPTFVNACWNALSPQLTVAGVNFTKQQFSGLRRFVRSKVNIPSGLTVNVCLDAVAREP